MKPPASELLHVIWNGEQVPGVSFHGLFERHGHETVQFPREPWPDAMGVHEFLLHNDHWEVAVWDVPMASWPTGTRWREAVRTTFSKLLASGARVAWIGLEGLFCDPPDLFTPSCMSGGVLAALTCTGDFWCPVDPHAPLAALTDDQLLRLRQASEGLSDVG